MEVQPQPSLWESLGNWLGEHVPLIPDAWAPTIGAVLGCLFMLLLFVMPLVTYMIWWLRKWLGWLQSRLGPKHVGPHGLLQTPADAVKLMAKEDIIPLLADRIIFTLAPGLVFLAAFLAWATVPLGPGLVVKDLNVGLLYIGAVTSVTVVGIVLAAWSSNNKYALVSAFRSAAQMVSYEVPLLLALMVPVLMAQSLSLGRIIEEQIRHGWFFLYQPLLFFAFFTAAMAENNVTPFDLAEAESEIVAGFHVEYSGMKFALFFLAEFANTALVAALAAILFFGGWHSPLDPLLKPETWPGPRLGTGPESVGLLHLVWGAGWFTFKMCAAITLIFHLRGTLPRTRIDQLMEMGWKVLIPFTLINLALVGAQIAFNLPRVTLAIVNWGLFVALIALGRRKPLPTIQRHRVPAREGALPQG